MLAVQEVTRSYGAVRAVAGVSFRVARGEIVGFLGPNGAGKTTTLKILAGLLAPDRGSVSIDGLDVTRQSVETRRRVGYLPEGAPLWDEMRVVDLLTWRARLKGVPRRGADAEVRELCAATGLGEVERRVVGTLSRGFRQRVALADALIGRPPVLLLDEPTTGLDPNQARHTRELVQRLGANAAVLFSSHALAEVAQIATRVIIIAAGELRADGTPDAVVAALAPGRTLEEAFASATEGR